MFEALSSKESKDHYGPYSMFHYARSLWSKLVMENTPWISDKEFIVALVLFWILKLWIFVRTIVQMNQNIQIAADVAAILDQIINSNFLKTKRHSTQQPGRGQRTATFQRIHSP